MRWEVSGSTAAVLCGVASRMCSKKHVAFLCSSHLAFFLVFHLSLNGEAVY